MCGRFTLFLDPADLQDAFPEFTFPPQGTRRYNIAPTQPVLVLPNDGSQRANFFTWGLIPSWAKDPAIGSRMINARGETLSEKPSFRSAYRYRRCLVFTNGFFEWQPVGLKPTERHAEGVHPSVQPVGLKPTERNADGKVASTLAMSPSAQPSTASKTKVPHLIHLRSGEPFAFAGLWERWQSPEGSEVLSTTIITTEPNELMASIHNRMPVILPRTAYARWLETTPRFPADLQDMLVPYPAVEMEAYPVSTLVNNPAYDRPEVIIRV
jgi:putative SOS response-associated peptidase YedK